MAHRLIRSARRNFSAALGFGLLPALLLGQAKRVHAAEDEKANAKPAAANHADTASSASVANEEALARKQAWAKEVSSSQNLFQVTPNFFRSARLLRSDVPLLQKLGITTVVSLRAFHTDEDVLAGSKIKMQRVPMLTWDIDDKEIIIALKALKAAEKNGAVLLHCQHGADRTGVVTAMYRIVYMGWSRAEAMDELQNGGFGFHKMWKNIIRYLKKVDIEKIKQAVL